MKTLFFSARRDVFTRVFTRASVWRSADIQSVQLGAWIALNLSLVAVDRLMNEALKL
jgi:hypothetical protein